MSREEIFNELKNILLAEDDRNAALIDQCTEDTRLIDDLGLNSIGILYLVISIEETFGIRFENADINTFKTVGEVMDYIVAKVNATA